MGARGLWDLVHRRPRAKEGKLLILVHLAINNTVVGSKLIIVKVVLLLLYSDFISLQAKCTCVS